MGLTKMHKGSRIKFYSNKICGENYPPAWRIPAVLKAINVWQHKAFKKSELVMLCLVLWKLSSSLSFVMGFFILDSYEQKWLTQEFMKQETWLPFLALEFTFCLVLEKSLKPRSISRLGLFQASGTQDLCKQIRWVNRITQSQKPELKNSWGNL